MYVWEWLGTVSSSRSSFEVSSRWCSTLGALALPDGLATPHALAVLGVLVLLGALGAVAALGVLLMPSALSALQLGSFAAARFWQA